jgi:hypothetical protein
MDNSTASISAAVTPRHLLMPSVGAIAIGCIYLFWRRDRFITGQALGLAWVFISMIGSSAYHVSRALQKRIADLETELATLKRSAPQDRA